MKSELSPVQICKKNKWKKGTVLQCTWPGTIAGDGKEVRQVWKITGFGEFWVLGRQINLGYQTTSGEEIVPFFLRKNWRKTTQE